MKRILFLLTAGLLLLSLAACTGGAKTAPTVPAATESPEETASAAPASAPATNPAGQRSSVLVVYFSATGTTKGVAERIAAIENADLYEIQAVQPYSSADLNWSDRNSRSTREQNDKAARPDIGSAPLDLAGYTKIYVGFPIWWGEEPRILDTFAESYAFDGVTMIPFCTSSSSGIGRSGRNLAEIAGSGNWLDGRRFGAGVSDAELQTWIDSLK